MGGAEFGWALACADDIQLAAAMRGAGGADVPTLLLIRNALTRFGTNALRVEDWELDGDELTVYIDALPPDRYSPCAQALLEASIVLRDVQTFGVRLPNRSGPAMVASRSVLLRMLPAWIAARQMYPKMPPVVFLPVLFQSRLLVETPESAASATVWLALNEAVNFLADFQDTWPRRGLRLEDFSILAGGLDMACLALETSAHACPAQSSALVGRAHHAIRGAARYAGWASDDFPGAASVEALRRLERMERKINQLWEDLPPCAPLPTVDPTPLQPR